MKIFNFQISKIKIFDDYQKVKLSEAIKLQNSKNFDSYQNSGGILKFQGNLTL